MIFADLAVLPASRRHRHSDTSAYRLISFVGLSDWLPCGMPDRTAIALHIQRR
jgi:hypothetical protein